MNVPLQSPEQPELVKLNLGCGFSKAPGHKGVDRRADCEADIVYDLTVLPWPFENESVDEIFCSHLLQYLTPGQRIGFMNECYRIMKSSAKMTIICPYWTHQKSIMDPLVKYPPLSEVSFAIYDKDWRDRERLPDYGIQCNFNAVCGHGIDIELAPRAQEHQQYAARYFTNAVADLHATLTKK